MGPIERAAARFTIRHLRLVFFQLIEDDFFPLRLSSLSTRQEKIKEAQVTARVKLIFGFDSREFKKERCVKYVLYNFPGHYLSRQVRTADLLSNCVTCFLYINNIRYLHHYAAALFTEMQMSSEKYQLLKINKTSFPYLQSLQVIYLRGVFYFGHLTPVST